MPIVSYPVDPIADPAAWHALRAEDVTASAAAALFGVHPYQTAYGLWALKSGKVFDDIEELPPMMRGRLLEPVAVALLREQRPGWKISHGGLYFRDTEARLGGTPDVLIADNGTSGIVQIKSVEPSTFRRKWIDGDGVIEAPLHVAVQAAVEAYLTGSEVAYVGALVVGFGIDLHVLPVPIPPGFIDRVKEAVADFWAMVETGNEPALDYRRDDALLSALHSSHDDELIDLSGDNELPALLEERETLKKELTGRVGRVDEIDCAIKGKIGDHAGFRLPGWRVTWKTQHRNAYTMPAKDFRVLRTKRIG